MKNLEFAIIGSGIAGSLLSLELLKKGKTLKIYDMPSKASLVAGGIINPLMGSNLTLSWKDFDEEMLPFLKHYYKNLEEELKVKFYREIEIFKAFKSASQSEEFKMKLKNSENLKNISFKFEKKSPYSALKALYGGLTFKGALIENSVLIESLINYFKAENLYIQSEVRREKIKITNSGFKIDSFNFKNIIFARGYREESGFFSYLPFKNVKGESLILEIKNLNLKSIYNDSFQLIPLERDLFYIGSTYEKETLNEIITSKGREELLNKLNLSLNLPYKVLKQKAHIRAFSNDKKALLGEHPKIKNMFIFNGFGSKGFSLSPYLSQVMSEYILKERELDFKIDIKRYENYFKELNEV